MVGRQVSICKLVDRIDYRELDWLVGLGMQVGMYWQMRAACKTHW